MKYLIFIFCFINISCQFSGKVIGIKDGDTIVIISKNFKKKVLRLAEIDCPESGQAFGKNAKQFTSSEVFGKEIKYKQISVDRYGRTIAKVYYDADNKYLSSELLKKGLAWWYKKYSADPYLGNLEAIARNKKIE